MMTQRKIRISTIAEAKDFVARASECDFDINIFYNRVIIEQNSHLESSAWTLQRSSLWNLAEKILALRNFWTTTTRQRSTLWHKDPAGRKHTGAAAKGHFRPLAAAPFFIRSRPRPWPALHRCFRSSSENRQTRRVPLRKAPDP